MADLNTALEHFEAADANLKKLERLWDQIAAHIPSGPAFGSPPEYDALCFAFRRVLAALPAINGFRVEDRLHEYNAIGQMRLDALEIDDIACQLAVDDTVNEQGRVLQEYRLMLEAERRDLIRDRLLELIEQVDAIVPRLTEVARGRAPTERMETFSEPDWSTLNASISEIDALLGSTPRAPNWGLLRKHLSFGMVCDLSDIRRADWPNARKHLLSGLYGESDPVPIRVPDLAKVVASRPQGSVPTKLDWSALSDENFERLIFLLISETSGYENPEWLQHTHAPDRGRDISAFRVENDPLLGVKRYRVIIQCKHWLSKSISPREIETARVQMPLWEPPRVDQLIVATSGRFTADDISVVEKHNQADKALNIALWPESHLEVLLASRPHLIGEFLLKRVR